MNEARSTDRAAIATLEGDLRCRVTAANAPFEIYTDMPKAMGGTATAPSPGWLSRAALASCEVSMIALRAAQLGIQLRDLEVTVDSESDDRGLLGVEEAVPAGPLSVRVAVKIGAAGVLPGHLNDLVNWAERHSPVGDAIRRAIPSRVDVSVVESTIG